MLNLKANFIDTLPDITPLKSTVVYINLSYNHFEEVPVEIYELHQLEVLKVRNNPITRLPDKFSALQNLRLLNLAYCKLKEWPEW